MQVWHNENRDNRVEADNAGVYVTFSLQHSISRQDSDKLP